MQILIITQYYWPEQFRINDLARGLQARGHEITVLTGLPNYPSGKIFEGYGWTSCGSSNQYGITVCRVPLLARREGKPWQLALNYLSFVFFSCLFGPFLCRGKYDLVFVFEPSPFTVGIPGVLFRYLKKTPFIFWVQDLWPESIVATGTVHSPFLLALVARMVRFIYQRCDCILVQSRRFESSVIKAGADPDKILYFPNWAEDTYKPVVRDITSQQAKELPNGFRVMFAGNLGAAQSLETIVQAAVNLRQTKDIKWVIIGDGRNRSWLEQKIREFNLVNTIHLLGRRPVESMSGYFALADVLLVTLKNSEIFKLTIPSKIQSYLACGKPVIAAIDGEGATIINESGAGFAVPAEDAKALADAVLKMYRSPDAERIKMGTNGRQYYEQNFDRESLFTRLEVIFRTSMKKSICAS